jgi:hypothetical protein
MSVNNMTLRLDYSMEDSDNDSGLSRATGWDGNASIDFANS